MSAARTAAAPFLVFAGCQHRPTIVYPKPVEAGPTEAGLDCARLDDAILKADAVRWVMRQDGARLLSPDERDGRVSGDVLLAALSVMACFGGLPVYLGDEGHAFVDGADRRLLSLLKLKLDKGCPARPTSIPGMDDLQIYDGVSGLVSEEARKRVRGRISGRSATNECVSWTGFALRRRPCQEPAPGMLLRCGKLTPAGPLPTISPLWSTGRRLNTRTAAVRNTSTGRRRAARCF